MIIGQNTAKIYDFVVLDYDNNPIQIDLVDTVEFCFDEEKSKHQVIKLWKTDGSGTVEYDAEKQIFYVPLVQEETVHFNFQIPMQIRVKFKDGTVERSDIEMWYVNASLSKEVI